MQNQNALILYATVPQIDRSSTSNPFVSFAWEDLDVLYTAMFNDLLRISCQLVDVDILVYRNPNELSDDLFIPFKQRIQLFPVNESPIAEQIQTSMMDAFHNKYQKVVILLNNNPLLSRALLKKVFHQLGYEDDCIVIGPTFDGRCYLLGMKVYHDSLLNSGEGDPLRKADILLRNICQTSSFVFPLEPLYSWDAASNLLHLRRTLENMNKGSIEFPSKTYEVFRIFDKKYKLKKYLA